ncbi:jg1001 [Pararge aegeria aegeria]|uniref:Jg1001 protein n=1 Tax=Pararge aegeria aegeria TaxID=348720 RepID=A0A8S4QLT1_9NEOP|nr:jg1001 [Pararge aegeria aegeria]
MRGELLFNSWNEMFDGSGAELKYDTELYSFNGKDVMMDAEWPTKAIWHGYGPAEALGLNCASWHNGRPNSFGLASTLTTNKLLDVETYPCSTRLIVLCLERKPEVSIKISKPPPRRIRKPVSEDDLQINKTSELEKTLNRTIRLEINPEFEITEEEFLEYNEDLNITTPTDIV